MKIALLFSFFCLFLFEHLRNSIGQKHASVQSDVRQTQPKTQTRCKKGLLPFWVPFPLFFAVAFIFIEKLQCCRFHLPKIIRTKPSLTGSEAPLRKPLLLLSDADQQIFSCDAWLPTSASHTSACMPFGKIRPTFQQVTTGSTFNRIDLHIWAYPILLLLPIYL